MYVRRFELAHQRDSPGSGPVNLDLRVLKLIANGESYDEAASILQLAPARIHEAMARMREDFGAHTNEHAVAITIRSGLLG